MKEILKSKTHMMGKLFIYQIAMSLLGLFVVSPFKGKLQIAAAVFSTLFYFSLVCYAVIEDGQKDCISSKIVGNGVGSRYTGFVYALVSYIPTIIAVVVQMLLFLFSSDGTITGLKAILAIIIRFFLMGMYLGFDTGLADRFEDPVTHEIVSSAGNTVLYICDNYILFAVLLILTPVVCGITYALAYNGKIHVNTEKKQKK